MQTKGRLRRNERGTQARARGSFKGYQGLRSPTRLSSTWSPKLDRLVFDASFGGQAWPAEKRQGMSLSCICWQAIVSGVLTGTAFSCFGNRAILNPDSLSLSGGQQILAYGRTPTAQRLSGSQPFPR